MRKIACISRLLALAEPVPFTVAILNAKSLMPLMRRPPPVLPEVPNAYGITSANFCHVPRRRRAALGAQSAVQADVFVLHHHALRLRQRLGHVESLRRDSSPAPTASCADPISDSAFGVMVRQLTGHTSTHASHSMQSVDVKCVSTSQLRQRSTSVAVCSAVKPSSTSTLDLRESLDQLRVLHLGARRRIEVVQYAHECIPIFVLARCMPCGGRSATGTSLAVLVNGDGRLMSVLHRPDDVLTDPTPRRRRRTRRRACTPSSSCRRPACPTCRTRCRCRARSTGNALSCPMARMTSSHGRMTVSMTVLSACRSSRSTRGARTPCRRAFRSRSRSASAHGSRRCWIASSSASSSSHGDALKYGRERRATTFVSTPPSRREVRQQSMAVLPTPMMSTRGADPVDVAEVNGAEPLDADVDLTPRGVVPAAGDVELLSLRRAAADEDRVDSLRRAAPSGSRPACRTGPRRPCR